MNFSEISLKHSVAYWKLRIAKAKGENLLEAQEEYNKLDVMYCIVKLEEKEIELGRLLKHTDAQIRERQRTEYTAVSATKLEDAVEFGKVKYQKNRVVVEDDLPF